MDNILDEMIRREVQIQRFATFMVNSYVTPTSQQISREIGSFLIGYEDLAPGDRNKLVNDVKRYVERQWNNIFVNFDTQMGDLMNQEADFILDLYNDYIPESERLIPISPFSPASSIMSVATQAGTWANFVASNLDDTVKAVNGVVQGGIRDGATVQQMVQQIRGQYNRKSKEYQGGILTGKQARRAEALIRTGTNHHVNAVRDRFADQNTDVIQKRIFFATLDSRTTTICFANHLREWSIKDKTYPRLPLHFNERSVYIFKTRGFNPLNVTRPSKGGKKEEGEMQVEMIKANTNAATWLKRQPRWFVEESLGETRASLFLDGGLDIKSMIDLQNRPLTLAQLAETTKGRRAMIKAGLR